MAWSSLPIPTGKSMALAFVATSLLAALFAERVSGPQEARVPAGPAGSDHLTMIQGKPHVHMSIYEQEEILAKDAGIPNPVSPPPQPDSSFLGTITSVVKHHFALLGARVRETVASIKDSVVHTVNHVAERIHASTGMSTKASTGMTIGMVVACCVLSFCALSFCFYGAKRRTREQINGQRENLVAETSQRNLNTGSLMARSPQQQFSRPGTNATLNGAPAYPTHDMPPTSGSFGVPAPRQLNSMESAGSAYQPSSCTSFTDAQRQSVRPPPLCPTLVMPMSEALLGIQMYELAQLSQEGALNIVGISGKPLLRAEVKRVGVSRSLEISMPEPNSIPRATIAPPVQGDAGHGGRALEIRGMRGSFYGILQMQSSGACYVVKDGQTVLTIDGDAESLQLALKSAVGMQLASVKCSTEQFEGVDHVELRVEPGVDTVLVVAVVLAVLLLSPYLPPED